MDKTNYTSRKMMEDEKFHQKKKIIIDLGNSAEA
jgi:hypothetical protein